MKLCLLCRSRSVAQFLNLGRTALANRFLRKDEIGSPETRYALRVGFCQACGHVQLMDSVPPSEMFEKYLYISSASDTLKRHLWDLSDDLVQRYGLGAKDTVVDIGCNDGTLLMGFKRHGLHVLGVDPALNLADLASGDGIERCTELFTAAAADKLVARWGHATLVTATNTFPHVQDLEDFIRGVKILLKPGGVFVIEAHYLLDLVEQVAFDTIYHEHVSYWALGPMQRLFQAHGMCIVDAERLALHHGQLRVHVQRQGEGATLPGVAHLLSHELAAGFNRFDSYIAFAQKVQRVKRDLPHALAQLAAQGERVVGYGAPAKANTLLEYLDIGPALLPYIVDRSPLKQGLFTPGMHIPIAPPERLLADQPEYVLLLAWNFAEEIVEQQAEYRRRGGKFLVPLPEMRLI